MKPLALAAICFLLTTCITSYDYSATEHTPKLVVDGRVTDQPGPHRINLSYSTPYFNEAQFDGKYIDDATVSIEDNDGIRTTLQHSRRGTYETPGGFTGKPGKHYTLTITLANGKEYRSLPEEMKFVPPIDTIVGEYRELPEGDLRGEFDLSIETKDPSTKEDFYQYRWLHYELKPYCYLQQDPNTGFINVVDCCENCWAIDQCAGCINILSDAVVNGGSLKVPIATIPYDSKEPYFILVEQHSLTEEAYQFWKNVSTQINSSGGIFDSPPITIRGNIFNTNDPQEQVLGFFGASSVAVKSIHFQRNKISRIPFGTDRIYFQLNSPCIPCEVGLTRTTQTPTGW